MLAGVERPFGGAQEAGALRAVPVGAERVSRRVLDLASVVVDEVDPGLDAAKRRLYAADGKHSRAPLGRAGRAVAPEPRERAAQLGSQLLRVTRGADLLHPPPKVALDRRGRRA